MPDAKQACPNLYAFIRLCLGDAVSDREIARRWHMDWKSFSALKHGRRKMPRIDELEGLARILKTDAALVFEVARGVPARKVHKLLQENDHDKLAQLLMAGLQDARREAESTADTYRAVLDRVQDAIFTTDLQGRLQDFNHRFLQLTGYGREELAECLLFDLIAPSQTPRLMEVLAKVYSQSEPQRIEIVMREKSGTEFFMDFGATRIDNAEGQAIGVQGIGRDVTERRRAEEALRDSEERYRVLAETAQDSIFLIDAQGCVAYVNSAGAALLGQEPGELVGKPVSALFPPETHERQSENLQKAYLGEAIAVEFEYPFPTGALWLSTRLVPMRGRDGKITGVLGVSRDVTERRRAQDKLQEQLTTLESVVDATPAACMLFAKDGTILLANRLVENVCAYTASEVTGRNAFHVFGNPGPEGCPVTRCFLTAKPEQQLSRVTNRLGQEVYVHRTAGPILNAAGGVERVVEILVDVTEQLRRGDARLLALWHDGPLPPELADAKEVEKRQFVRLPIQAPVQYRVADPRSHPQGGLVRNLGRGGLFVETTEPLPNGTRVELQWTLHDSGKTIKVEGVVAWSTRGDGASPAGMGIRFTEVEGESQGAIVTYLRRASAEGSRTRRTAPA